MAQLVAHLVRDQEVAGSSPVIQTMESRHLRFRKCLLLYFYEWGYNGHYTIFYTTFPIAEAARKGRSWDYDYPPDFL